MSDHRTVVPEVRALVEELDRLIPRDGARLKLPADPDGNSTAGTQRGYLRLGVELLRAALAPIRSGASGAVRIEPDIGYLLTPESDDPFELCEIDEQVGELPARSTSLGLLGQLVVGVAIVTALGVFLVGIVAVVSWLFR